MGVEGQPAGEFIEVPEKGFKLVEFLDMIEGPQGEACRKFYDTYQALIDTAPGSRGAHHAWRGGYKHHVEQTMNHFIVLYESARQRGHLSSLPPEEQFTLSEGLVVAFWHDAEKPFMYQLDMEGKVVPTERALLISKEERKKFRKDLMTKYSLELAENQINAMQHTEGVRDEDYVPGSRPDKPLATMCAAADTYSARVLYDRKESY